MCKCTWYLTSHLSCFSRDQHQTTATSIANCISATKVAAQISWTKSWGKNNYYFLVLNLAICDLAALIKHLLDIVPIFWLEKPLYVYVIGYVLECIGVGMMLIISLLRYRAIVHPLKPAISKRKMKVVCGLVYLVGFIVESGTRLPRSFIKRVAYRKFYLAFWMFFAYFIPTIFMAVVYYKISRSLIKQREYMKRVCSNPVGISLMFWELPVRIQ